MRRSWRGRQILPLLATAVLVAACGTDSSSEAGPAMSENEVEQSALDFVNSLTAAYAANTLDEYFAHYATDMTVFRGGERWSWDGYYELWTETIATSGGVAAAEVSDAQVRVSSEGDAAAVSYILTADYHGEGDSVSRSQFAMSTTLMRRDGEWKIVHLQFVGVPEGD
jgi:ketosteroid isomerase-like protein